MKKKTISVVISSPSKEALEKAVQKFLFTGQVVTCEDDGSVSKGTTGKLKYYKWRKHKNRFQLINNESTKA